jgi:hypothetical protein
MAIDPMVLLAEDLRSTEAALDEASRAYFREHRKEDGEMVNVLIARLKRLYGETLKTAPTSALGAAELVRIAARHVPFTHARYATHLQEIADRLSLGQKDHADLIWLRALQAALAEGLCGRDGDTIAPWLKLAVIGASRPVMVFRSVLPDSDSPPWRNILSQFDSGKTHENQLA